MPRMKRQQIEIAKQLVLAGIPGEVASIVSAACYDQRRLSPPFLRFAESHRTREARDVVALWLREQPPARGGSSQLAEMKAPEYISIVETLGIFGVRAGYMTRFREHLRAEGIPDAVRTFHVPVGKRPKRDTLKMLRAVKGLDFRVGGAAPLIDVGTKPDLLMTRPVLLDWYPRVRSITSKELAADLADSSELKLSVAHLRWLDFDSLHRELVRFKAEKGWDNLTITRSGVEDLLMNPDWYELLIPDEALAFTSLSKKSVWHEVALALLKRYAERFYRHHQAAWEKSRLQYEDLADDDPNFLEMFGVHFPDSDATLLQALQTLTDAINAGRFSDGDLGAIKVLDVESHLYYPLVAVGPLTAEVRVTPVPLNEGEEAFVRSLRRYLSTDPETLSAHRVYLLRNLSRGRGLGFFEAENFHPDFILWVLDRKSPAQHIVFVDPKGMARVDPGHAKVEFHRSIKDIENRLEDPHTYLHSFLVSRTPFKTLKASAWRDHTKESMREKNVLFRDDDDHIQVLFDRVLNGGIHSASSASTSQNRSLGSAGG